MESSDEESAELWYVARFRFDWPEGSDPLWHLDLVVGHAVIEPLLRDLGGQVALWYFHRRANHDSAGHEFAFSFLSTATVANGVAARLRESPVLSHLARTGSMLDYAMDPSARSTEPPFLWPDWPPEMKAAWPHFVMGVFGSWLALAGHLLGTDAPVDPVALVARYEEVSRQVGELWHEWGGHVFLHHVNAAYAYIPVRPPRTNTALLRF